MDRQASWYSPVNTPRSRVRRNSPPPVQALQYPTQPNSPVLVLPAPHGTPAEDRLALAWPPQQNISQELAESGSFANASGSATYHTRAIVTVSPSGETTMHIQSSYYSVHSPGVPGGSRLHCSPGSREIKAFSTPGSGGARTYSTPRKQLAFPGTPGSRFIGGRSSSNSSFGTPHSANTSNGSVAPPPGRSLLFEQSSRDSPVRKRNLPALTYNDGDATRTDRTTRTDRPAKVSSQVGSDMKKRKTLTTKEYKGVLEQDHPEEPTGRGMFCTCICTLLSVLLFVVLLALVLWFIHPFGDPVLKIGMAPIDALSVLKADLDRNVFGQHIANRLVVSSMQGLLVTGGAPKNEPVIISFHGSTGVGKTHMADILSKHFVDSPNQPTCSHTFLTDLHIPVSSDLLSTSVYELIIQNWVKDQLRYHKSCKYLFLIFDELRADTPAELALALSNVLSEIKLRNEANNGVTLVAIVMSDIGMHDINAHLSGVWDSGTPRENVTSNELVLLIKNAASYMDRFSQQQSAHQVPIPDKEQHPFHHGPFSHLLSMMDTIVPFLPLERSHLKLCIVHDAISKDVTLLEEADVTWVADQLSYFPPSSQVFSLAGCKKVSEKVDLLRQKL